MGFDMAAVWGFFVSFRGRCRGRIEFMSVKTSWRMFILRVQQYRSFCCYRKKRESSCEQTAYILPTTSEHTAVRRLSVPQAIKRYGAGFFSIRQTCRSHRYFTERLHIRCLPAIALGIIESASDARVHQAALVLPL